MSPRGRAREVAPLGEVLPQQAVEVLDAPLLPGSMHRVEVGLRTGGLRDARPVGELLAAVRLRAGW